MRYRDQGFGFCIQGFGFWVSSVLHGFGFWVYFRVHVDAVQRAEQPPLVELLEVVRDCFCDLLRVAERESSLLTTYWPEFTLSSW